MTSQMGNKNFLPRATGNSRRPTIRDVARDAGISKTSVSRYFGAERHRLSDTMQQRIECSVARLGFRPDRIAASLRGRQTRLIGALVADIRNPYSVALIHAVERVCGDAGYSLMVCNTDNEESLERRHLEVLDGYSVDGLIVNTVGRNTEALEAMRLRDLPMVLVDRRIDALDCDMVGLDDSQAITQAFDHLIARGFTRIDLFIEPVADVSSRIARAEAFDIERRRHNIQGEIHEVALDDEANDTLDARLAKLNADNPATAVLCANGVVTLAVCHALSHIDALNSIGVLGIDELAWCALAGPGISTLAQPVDTIGRYAAEALIARIDGVTGPAQVHRLPATLNARGSTALR